MNVELILSKCRFILALIGDVICSFMGHFATFWNDTAGAKKILLCRPSVKCCSAFQNFRKFNIIRFLGSFSQTTGNA